MIRYLLKYFFVYLQSYSSKTLSLLIVMWNEILYLVKKIKLSWTERYHISGISLYPNYVLGMTTPMGLIERCQTGLKLVCSTRNSEIWTVSSLQRHSSNLNLLCTVILRSILLYTFLKYGIYCQRRPIFLFGVSKWGFSQDRPHSQGSNKYKCKISSVFYKISVQWSPSELCAFHIKDAGSLILLVSVSSCGKDTDIVLFLAEAEGTTSIPRATTSKYN